MTLAYNVPMLAVDAGLLVLVAQRRKWTHVVLAAEGAVIVGLGLAAWLGGSMLGSVRLLAWGALFHGTVVVAGVGVLLVLAQRGGGSEEVHFPRLRPVQQQIWDILGLARVACA